MRLSDQSPPVTRGDVITIAFQRGAERYCLIYAIGQETEAMRQLGRWASEPSLSFSWMNAGELAREIRRETNQEA